jgi:hypothetical protein
MKTKMLRVVDIKDWALTPKAGEMFRVGGDAYYCYFTWWRFAVTRFDHTMEWEW